MRRGALALSFVLTASAASAQDRDLHHVDKPIVTVNGEPIMRSTLAEILAPLKKAKLPKPQVNELARKYLRELVKGLLLDQFMREEGYEPSAEEIDSEIARFRRIYETSRQPGAPSFESALHRRGTSARAMRKTPTAGMRFSCYVRGKMTERDLLRLFETERHGFDGTEVRARHILIDPRRLGATTDLARRDSACQRAVEIRSLALDAGPDPGDEKFADLAREHSHCASAAKGGDLGFFRRFGAPPFGVVTDEFAKAAFAAEVGDIPPVFETRSGFHVMKVTGRRPGKPVTFEAVRGEVADVWARRKGLEIYDELHRKAKIEWPE